MKEKTEWKKPAVNTMVDRWEGIFTPEFTFFLGGANLKWVNYYSREVSNALGARAGQIIGDE